MQAPVFIKRSDANGSKHHAVSQASGQPPFPYGISPGSVSRTPPFQPSGSLTFSMQFSSSPHIVWQATSSGSFPQQFSFTPTGPGFPFSSQNGSNLVLSVTPNSNFSSAAHLQSLEANFCKNFTCCGIKLEDLHGLLEHFEERHVNPGSQISSSPGSGSNTGFDVTQLLAAAFAAAQQQSQNPQASSSSSANSSSFPAATPPFPAIGGVPEWETMEMDGIEMDLDDDLSTSQAESMIASTSYAPLRNGNQVNINGNTTEHLPKVTPSPDMLHQGQRLSRRGVDIPSAGASPATSNSLFSTPENSLPGTPLGEELDQDFLDQFAYALMNQQQQQAPGVEGGIHPSFFHGGFGGVPFPTTEQPTSPAPRASQTEPSSPTMSEFPNPHAVGINRHASLSGTPSSPKKVKTPPVGKKIKPPPSSENENSSLNLQSLSPSSLLSLSTSRAFAPPPKPFKCPVPGCEKSYKQMNGLKYHRIHGHCNATVTVPMDGVTGGEGDANRSGDVAMSNVNGGNGVHQIELPYDVEESKPFMCHQGGCGKRYKNMNGLRYHYSHSGPHGQLGLQLLNTGSHPPPQYPSGYIPPRHPNANVSNQSSRTGSRTTSESPPPSMDRKGSQCRCEPLVSVAGGPSSAGFAGSPMDG